ncbi:hypothetical protein APV28_0558 [Comamonas testosteroni]|nr:hypothetical protein APV28_0558 [Comamonas testosteroni]
MCAKKGLGGGQHTTVTKPAVLRLHSSSHAWQCGLPECDGGAGPCGRAASRDQ